MNDPLPRCPGCGNSMRPRKTRAADWPGTVGRTSGTECSSCSQRRRKAAERHQLGRTRRRNANMLEPDELAANPALAAYIRARRSRGIPATGRAAA